MLEITPKDRVNAVVSVPGSKSCTHRLTIAAALSEGVCRLSNPLQSEDTLLTLSALQQMGIVAEKKDGVWEIHGGGGRFQPCHAPIYLANSGTSMRLLTAVAVLGHGSYTFTGSERMQQRPIQDLLAGMEQIGVVATSQYENGSPPVVIHAKQGIGGQVALDCSLSSQYLSGLLLMAPCTAKGIEIKVIAGPVSKPYIDLTIDVLNRFGIIVERDGYQQFQVPGQQCYRSGDYVVESDGSHAGYFWAAAAITGGTVKVAGITQASQQGDVGLADVLSQMGCQVQHHADGIQVSGGTLSGVDVDMGDMPDAVPTLAVVAAFAKGTTRIFNVSHLREKECDRLDAVATQLAKMGAKVTSSDSGLEITGSSLQGATIETYNDHRMAMSFAMAGLKVPGVWIEGESCVEKSFPTFWQVFREMCR